MKPRLGFPSLGFGLGLRSVHEAHILEHKPALGFLEIISENFMDTRGWPRRRLERVAEHYPIVMHGVCMSIGSTDPLNMDYLRSLKRLRDELGIKWISDHLCWTGVNGQNTHQLLPTPYTEEVLKLTVKRIKQVQEVIEAPLILENPSSYFEFTRSTMHEADFIRHMAEESDCGLLLDVNNVYVSAFNHDFDAFDYLDRIPHERVVQYHLAGHSNYGEYILDTHDDYVVDGVWKLLAASYPRSSSASVMVEWDDKIPAFEVLYAELEKAKACCVAEPAGATS